MGFWSWLTETKDDGVVTGFADFFNELGDAITKDWNNWTGKTAKETKAALDEQYNNDLFDIAQQTANLHRKQALETLENVQENIDLAADKNEFVFGQAQEYFNDAMLELDLAKRRTDESIGRAEVQNTTILAAMGGRGGSNYKCADETISKARSDTQFQYNQNADKIADAEVAAEFQYDQTSTALSQALASAGTAYDLANNAIDINLDKAETGKDYNSDQIDLQIDEINREDFFNKIKFGIDIASFAIGGYTQLANIPALALPSFSTLTNRLYEPPRTNDIYQSNWLKGY